MVFPVKKKIVKLVHFGYLDISFYACPKRGFGCGGYLCLVN
jgi:hypothetical protein